MKENKTTLVSRLLETIASLLSNGMKERAVTTTDIWRYVQNQLDVAKVIETGRVVEGVSSGFVIDIYVDASSTYALVTKDDGKLYKIPVTVGDDNSIITEEPIEVTMEFSPVTGRQIRVKRMANGKTRWFAMPAAVAAVNRSGEIDSTKLFDTFIQYIERTGSYPELDFYHCGEQVLLGKADWIARDGITYCASGLFYDTPIAQASANSIEREKDYWGLSIAYIPTQEPEVITSEGISIPVYNSGINRFISLLPESAAASIMTSISRKEEVKRMNEKMKEALRKLTGDDLELFEQNVARIDEINREGETMVTRDASSPEPKEAKTEEDFTEKVTKIIEDILAKKAPTAEKVVEPATEPVQVMTAQVSVPEVDRTKNIEDAIKKLTETVAELAKTRDAQVQEVLDDLPAKIVRQKIIRPRAQLGVPASVSMGVERYTNLSEIANETLSRINPQAN